MIIHLVIYKLLLETKHLNAISVLMGLLCLTIYWCFLLFGYSPPISNAVQPQLLGVVSLMFSSSDFWLIIIGGPVICLIPDAFVFLGQQVFLPDPVTKVLFEQKFKDPNYDYREHFNKIQKSLQMRKRQTAIQSEQRKIMIAQR
jgi:hypothetical protein